MKTLLTKSFLQVFLSIAIVLIASGPLFYYLMERFYTNDIDEVVRYRTVQFKEEQIPLLSHIDLDIWNTYNTDIQIIDFNPTVPINKPISEIYYNKKKGVEVNYRVLNSLVEIKDKIHILSVRAPMIDHADLVENISMQHGLLFLFILCTFLWLHHASSNKLWKPFYQTLNQLNQFNLKNSHIPVFDKTTTSEFNQLNNHLNTLMRRVLDNYNKYKLFIENASHELQTPIAILTSQLDLLLQESNLSEEQTRILQSLYKTTSRVSRLNKNLLLLAKIENEQFEERDNVNVETLVNEFFDQFKELAEAKNIVISVSSEPMQLVTNRALLEIAISNLISNALRYNLPEKGCIEIELTKTSFSVSNSSSYPMLNREHIFQRFAKTNKEQLKGNGLGLAIVHQICEYNGWTISYRYINGKHLFEITFA